MHACFTGRFAVLAWTAILTRGGFLRLTLRQRRTSRLTLRLWLRFQLHRARGRAPGLGPALDEPGSSEHYGNRLGPVRLRVSPAPAGLTAVMLRRLPFSASV